MIPLKLETWIQKLGLEESRPAIFQQTSGAPFIPTNETRYRDFLFSRDFLVDRITITDNLDVAGAVGDKFYNLGLPKQNYNCYNRNGTFFDYHTDYGDYQLDGNVCPMVTNASTESPFCLPWIIPAGDILRFGILSTIATITAHQILITVSGWYLKRRFKASPFLPYVWTLNDFPEATWESVDDDQYAVTDYIETSGLGDFLCTNIGVSLDTTGGTDLIRRNTFLEITNERLENRQVQNRAAYTNVRAQSSSATMPLPYIIPNGSIVRSSINTFDITGLSCRYPQMRLFGYYPNPAYWNTIDLKAGILE